MTIVNISTCDINTGDSYIGIVKIVDMKIGSKNIGDINIPIYSQKGKLS